MDTWKCNPSKDQPRKIFEIDVGTLSTEEAAKLLQRMKEKFKIFPKSDLPDIYEFLNR